jgi:hypothetical protein
MTLCSRGRSTLVFTRVLGLMTVSGMPAEYSLEGGLETRVFSMASLRQQGWQSMKRLQHGLFPAF